MVYKLALIDAFSFHLLSFLEVQPLLTQQTKEAEGGSCFAPGFFFITVLSMKRSLPLLS